ncbi:MAG: hypothetical protein U9R69_03140, partial [Thermodesulfobacteriota bacterium]|nr:hypothetical protein [Thermodesulfobacteriota bacterium]
MTVKEPEISVVEDRPDGVVSRKIERQVELESPLPGGSDSMRAVKRIADQEVKVVGDEKKHQLASLFMLLSVAIFLLGAGCYLFFSPALSTPVSQQIQGDSVKLPIPARSENKQKALAVAAVATESPFFTVRAGPFLGDAELRQTVTWLQTLGLKSQKSSGHGQITMFRLLEGVYPAAVARTRLLVLKKVVRSAFLLPDGDNLAVYAGSFHQKNRAQQLRDDLLHEKINVTLVDSKMKISGTLLTVLSVDQETVSAVVAH